MPVLTANYPSLLPAFGNPKVDLQDIVFADHVNKLQREVLAIATAIGVTPTGAYATIKDRLAAIEAEIGQLMTTVAALGGGGPAPTSIPESSVTNLVADLANLQSQINALDGQVGGGGAGFVTLADFQQLTGAKGLASATFVNDPSNGDTVPTTFYLLPFHGAPKFFRARTYTDSASVLEIANQEDPNIAALVSFYEDQAFVAAHQWAPLHPWSGMSGFANGWSANGTVEAMMDASGNITLRGPITGGNTGSEALQVPSWAIPAYNHYFIGTGPHNEICPMFIDNVHGFLTVQSGWTNGSNHDLHIDTTYYAGA